MRLICLVNNYLGWQALEFLRAKAQVVGVVVHPPEKAKFSSEIGASAKSAGAKVFCAADLSHIDTRKAIEDLHPDLGISVMFGYLLRTEFLNVLPRGCLNLHPGYLPYNRGAHPNVWSIVEKTPAGVTLHWIDEGIDTGAIVAQKTVTTSCADTGESLYRKLESTALALLEETWPAIEKGNIEAVQQQRGQGTHHKQSDLTKVDEIQLERPYRAGELLDILRARTFPPHPGAFFRCNGKKIHIRVEFQEADDEHNCGR